MSIKTICLNYAVNVGILKYREYGHCVSKLNSQQMNKIGHMLLTTDEYMNIGVHYAILSTLVYVLHDSQ